MDKVAWRNEVQKEQKSLKKEAEKAMRKVEVVNDTLFGISVFS